MENNPHNSKFANQESLKYLIYFLIALLFGPVGWIILLIWLFGLNKNRLGNNSERLQNIFQSNNHIAEAKLTDTPGLSKTAKPLEVQSVFAEDNLIRNLVFICCLIAIGIVIYLYYFK